MAEEVVGARCRTARTRCLHGKTAQHQTLDKWFYGFGFERRDAFGVCERLLQSVLYDMPCHLVDGLHTDEVGDDPLGTGRDLGDQVGIARGGELRRRSRGDVRVEHHPQRRRAIESLLVAVLGDRGSVGRIAVHRRRGSHDHIAAPVVVRAEFGQVVDNARSHCDGNGVGAGQHPVQLFDERPLGIKLRIGVASPVYFSNEKWAECLASHGLVVDAEKQTLTVQSESVQADMVYDLTEEEVRTLVAAPIEEQPVEKRLELLNGIIGADFSDKVTMEALNSDQRIAIGLHPEVQQDLKQRQRQEQEAFMPVKTSLQQQEESVQGNIGAVVDGRDLQFLNENKGWYREEKHGREVEVSQIAVQPAQTEGKYRMTAVIDGQAISHEITQRDYDKFLAVDDYHRMKLFSKIFSEVDMKTRPEAQRGLGTKIFAALTAGTVVAAGVAHGIHHHCHAPEFYGECFGGPPRPYFKPGVDTPRDVAIRCFEAEMNREINDMRMGR